MSKQTNVKKESTNEPKEKLYRVWIEIIDAVYVDIIALNEEEAEELAQDEIENGEFVSVDNWSQRGETATQEIDATKYMNGRNTQSK